jgi:anti-sigma regulatory factor (Ser/Thr protein kinase)
MLPEQVHVAGLDVWTYYAPAGEHAQVGGDWYDVVHVSDEAVGVVIGDVTGHDVGAAATMGQLRSIVRSYACELVDPATVLERVDKLVAGMRIAREATLAYAALTPLDGAWEVAYIRAGHLPPLLVRDGRVTALDGGGSLLIGIGQPVRETAHATVVPGDVLVFYTDGLVERRDRSMRDGVAALADLCGRLTATDAAGVGEELLAQLADAPEDDVAVVVVRVPDPSRADVGGDGPPQRRWQLPADTSSIARARHAVVTTCAAWDIPEARAAELVVSELVANAVVHGWGRVDLRLADLGADGLRIEVEDSNPAAPTELDGHDSRIGGFGLQIIGRLADWGWQPTERGKVVWAQIRPARRTT